jgi:hypothetical protein
VHYARCGADHDTVLRRPQAGQFDIGVEFFKSVPGVWRT